MWKSSSVKVKNREIWLDITKAFGIGLVVLSHLNLSIPLVGFFGGMFFIPVFFVAAGYTYRNQGKTFFAYAMEKAGRLLVPYFICNVLLTGISMLLGRSFSKQSFLGIFYSRSMLMRADSPWNLALMPNLNAPTWFLTCLFLCLCIYYLLDCKLADAKKRRIAVGAAMGAGILLRTVSPVLLPWSIENALFFTGFLELGRFLKEEGLAWLRKNEWIYANFLIAFVALSYLNGSANVSVSTYGNSMLLYFFAGALGSVLCMKAAELTEKYLRLFAKPLAFVGRHTMTIMCWHLLAIEVIKKMLVLLGG